MPGKSLLQPLLFFLVIVASGSIFPLWKDGGARSEGVDSFVEYSGPLSYVPFVWSFLTILVCIAFIVFYRRLRNINIYSGESILFVYIIASLVWSQDFFNALKIVFPISAALFITYVSIRQCGTHFVFRTMSIAFLFVALLSFLCVLFIPSYGVSVGIHNGLWQGVFNHKNHLGNNMGLAVSVMLVVASYSKSRFWFFAALFPFVLTVLSGSTTSIFCSLLSFFFYSWLSRFKGARVKLCRKNVLRLSLIFIFLLTLFVFLLSFYASSFDILGKDATYSGRDRIWSYFTLVSMNNPILGVGVGQIALADEFQVSDLIDEIGFAAASTHNGYIDLLYSLGFLGVFLFLRLVFTSLKAGGDEAGYLIYVGLIPLFVLNVFEPRLIGFNVFFIFIVTTLYELRSVGNKRGSITLNSTKGLMWK
ncbi:MAG: O-antigen ligase family protein [bacterium]|nr:O-antigen ligase family protein [bacterium]